MSLRVLSAVVVSFVALAGVAPVLAQHSEAELDAAWRGAWVITRGETFSRCDDLYTDNRIARQAGYVASGGDVRFAPGEIARVDKVQVKRRRVDLLLTLETPLRIPWQDGPFTLYDYARCKVELELELPRELFREGDYGEIDRRLAELLERIDGPEAAERSDLWNGREAEPLPEGYDSTLAEYEVWKVEQVNGEVARRLERAVDEAAAIARYLDDDPEYLDGFARGTADARYRGWDDCPTLLTHEPAYYLSCSPDGSRSHDWREGYRDGYELVRWLEMARELRGCFLPVPPPQPTTTFTSRPGT